MLQDDLNEYCEAVSAPAGAGGMPFIDVLGHYLQLKRVNPGCPSFRLRQWRPGAMPISKAS
ncbi:hypothetical protein LNQ03_06870 [Klebsiella pneumoniae subsp. pneumoniae]|nr:hypothetical protein [Klebsiella pneumoniae subsp. pneumoniae]